MSPVAEGAGVAGRCGENTEGLAEDVVTSRTLKSLPALALLAGLLAPTVARAQAPYLVKNFTRDDNPSGSPRNFCTVENDVYFSGPGGLWKSDGTTSGTVLVGPPPGQYTQMTSAYGRLFCCDGNGIWTSDGTTAGTQRVAIPPATSRCGPVTIQVSDGVLYVREEQDFYRINPDLSVDHVLQAPGPRLVCVDWLYWFRAGPGRLYFAHAGHVWSASTSDFVPRDIQPPTVTGGMGGDGHPVGTKALIHREQWDDRTGVFWTTDWFAADGTSTGSITLAAGGSSPRGFCSTSDWLVYVDGGVPGATGLGTTVNARNPATGARLSTVISTGNLACLGSTRYGNSVYVALADRLLLVQPEGTPFVTTVVASAGTMPALPQPPVALPGSIVFVANGSTGTELWRVLGAVATRVLTLDTNPTTFPTQSLAVAGGKALFAASAPGVGVELWATDGTAAGTTVVKDLDSGPVTPGGTSLASFLVDSGKLYFRATVGPDTGLWESDGTEGGTRMLWRADAGPPSPQYVEDGKLAFIRPYADGDRLARVDLSSGVVSADSHVLSSPLSRPDANGVRFVGSHAGGLGEYCTRNDMRLWDCTGSYYGTGYEAFQVSHGSVSLPLDPAPGYFTEYLYYPWERRNTLPNSDAPHDFSVVSGRVLFSGYTERISGMGEALSSHVLMAPGSPDALADIGGDELSNQAAGLIYFPIQDPLHGCELGSTDGLTARLVMDIEAGTDSSSPGSFMGAGDRVYFLATTAANGRELYARIGKAGPVSLLADIMPGPESSNIVLLGIVPPWLYFQATAPGLGAELWATDGTPASTHLVADISPGVPSSGPAEFAQVAPDGTFCFVAQTPSFGRELYAGRGDQVWLVSDLNPGPASSSPGQLVLSGQRLFFNASDGTHGNELWALPVEGGNFFDPFAAASPAWLGLE